MTPATDRIMNKHRFSALLLLAIVATVTEAMPIHIGNVYPSGADAPLRLDVAVGRQIVARDLDYRQFVTVEGWPGANVVTFYRAGTTTPFAVGYITPGLFTPVSALERGYSVLVTRSESDETPLVVVASDNNPQSASTSATPPGFVTFAAPGVVTTSPTATVSSSCELQNLTGGDSRWSRTSASVDASVGRSYMLVSQVPASGGCTFTIELTGRRPFVLGGIPAPQGRTLRVVLIGDDVNRPLEALALYAGEVQELTGSADPLASIRGDSVWIAPDRPGLAYVGDDPVRAPRGAGFLLSSDEAGKPRWLLLQLGPIDDDGTRDISIYGATRPYREDTEATELGIGTLRTEHCNRIEIEFTSETVTTRRTYDRSAARTDCPPL
jgi:hypothetical protein